MQPIYETMPCHAIARDIDVHGFALREQVVSAEQRQRLLDVLQVDKLDGAVRRADTVYAARGLLWAVPELTEALRDAGLDELAAQTLGSGAYPVDALYFDKHTQANWSVPAHQDRLMPVAPVAGKKQRVLRGIPYEEPSVETLASLLSLRVHFDVTNAQNGALEMLPGSHRWGILSTSELLDLPLDDFVTYDAAPGDVLMVRPLTLHRSTRVQNENTQRRVLHVVYAGDVAWHALRGRVA